MTGLTHLSGERADSFSSSLKKAVEKMGTNRAPVHVSYRLDVTGMTKDGGEGPVTEFRVENFTSFYVEYIPPLLEGDEYIAFLGVHLDENMATISVVTEDDTPERDSIFV